MSNSNFEIDITLPLKSWERCKLSYDDVSAFCREKSIEFRTKAKEGEPTFRNDPLVPRADMYDLCIIMLNIAKNYGAELLSMTPIKKRVTFKFNFDSESCLDLFHEEFVMWLKRAKLVDPAVEIDQPKTFSGSKK
ncbi:MAG: hypothetical protein IKE91_01680 [Clostridia bacterium]|nr:hypothetical protein [Clostridia bacterium]